MYKKIISNIKLFVKIIKEISSQFNKQYAFELIKISSCSKTFKQVIEIKVNGKSQSISCSAEQIVSDDDFVKGFSSIDIRTITYLATSEKYEQMLMQDKIKKKYEIIRSESINNKKTIIIRNKMTGESFVKCIQNFSDQELIDNLDPMDAYRIGYLAGQEQTFRDLVRIRSAKIETSNENTMT